MITPTKAELSIRLLLGIVAASAAGIGLNLDRRHSHPGSEEGMRFVQEGTPVKAKEDLSFYLGMNPMSPSESPL